MTLKYLIGRRDEIRLELVEDMRRLARNLNNTANRLSDCDHPVNILGEVFSVLKKGGEFRSTTNYSKESIGSMAKRAGFSDFSYQEIQEPWHGKYFILKK